jgi:hypothetical protein
MSVHCRADLKLYLNVKLSIIQFHIIRTIHKDLDSESDPDLDNG